MMAAMKRLACLLPAALLAACAGLPQSLQPGDDRAAVLARLGPPTAEFALPGGGQRLQYASGPFGKHTWHVDLDAAGRFQRWEEALTEANFNRIEPGLTTAQLRERLGPPSRVWAVHYHDQTVWSYRFWGPFCLIFHVGLTPQGIVEDTSYGPDRACDGPRDRPGVR